MLRGQPQYWGGDPCGHDPSCGEVGVEPERAKCLILQKNICSTAWAAALSGNDRATSYKQVLYRLHSLEPSLDAGACPGLLMSYLPSSSVA